jgi:hypothetical protein
MKRFIRVLSAVMALCMIITFTACTNYKKMSKNNPIGYIWEASQNTLEAIASKDLLGISDKAYTALESGTVTAAFNSDYADVSVYEMNAGNFPDEAAGYGFDVSSGDSTFGGKAIVDSDGIYLSVTGGDEQFAYTVPYEDFEEKLKASIFDSDSGSDYALTSSEEEELIEFIRNFKDNFTDKDESHVLKELKKLPYETETKTVDVSDGEYDAYVITYDLSNEELADFVTSISDYIDDSDSYISVLSSYDGMLKASFAINKKANTLMMVDAEYTLSKNGEDLVYTLKGDFGGNPKTADEFTLEFGVASSDIATTLNVILDIDENTDDSAAYTIKIKANSKSEGYSSDLADIKIKCEFDKKSDEFTFRIIMDNDYIPTDLKLSGTIESGKKSAEVTVDNISGTILGQDFDELLDAIESDLGKKLGDYSISFKFSDENDLKKSKASELLEISEEELDNVTESLRNSLSAVGIDQ